MIFAQADLGEPMAECSLADGPQGRVGPVIFTESERRLRECLHLCVCVCFCLCWLVDLFGHVGLIVCVVMGMCVWIVGCMQLCKH